MSTQKDASPASPCYCSLGEILHCICYLSNPKCETKLNILTQDLEKSCNMHILALCLQPSNYLPGFANFVLCLTK